MLDGEPQLIGLHLLRLPHNIPAGLNPLRVMAIADHLRNGGGEVLEPVQVRRDGEDWLVVEGRHRVLGSWIAGRFDVLCIELP